MKSILKIVAAFVLLLTLNVYFSSSFAQGSLMPPGAPAPTMKTLSQIQPRIAISSAPFNITNSGSYYLTTNLSVTTGDAIDINASGVTLDLNGFTIYSTQSPAGGGIAIYLSASDSDITIVNGHISSGVTYSAGSFSGTGFGYGIYTFANVYNVRVAGVSVTGCLSDGIFIGFGSTLVDSCTVNVAGSYGIEGQIVENSQALTCGTGGINANTVINCTANAYGSGYGIQTTIANNCFAQAFGSGTGITATTANNCYGVGASSYGIYASYIAMGCYAYTTSGTALYALIGNSSYGQKSSAISESITYKYNMP